MGLSFSARRDGVKVFSEEERLAGKGKRLGLGWTTFSRIEDALGLTHTSTGWDYDGEDFADVILDIEAVRDASAAYLAANPTSPKESEHDDRDFISGFHELALEGIARGANAIYGL